MSLLVCAAKLCAPPELLHCSLLNHSGWHLTSQHRRGAHCHASDAKCAPGAVLAGRGAKRMRPEEQEYEDDFVVDDEEEPEWRQALKSITKYDPSK